jgi:hypothetical protein
MEAQESPANIITRKATAILPPKRFVRADGTVCALNARAIGVSYGNYAIGEPAAVITSGITGVETGGAFASGDEITSDATGRAIVAGSGKVNGIALDASTGAGQFVAVKVL